MNIKIKKDLYRIYGDKKEPFIKKLFRSPELKFTVALRKANGSKNPFRHFKLRKLSQKTGIQIPARTKIGEGLYIGHFGRLIINPEAVIGKNVNIATGVTIGRENRGKREGSPTIGNEVWIGTNAVIVGNIKIGDDVLIAPLSFVNFDVPSHSIVIGNPAKIITKSKEDTEESVTYKYIENKV